MTYVQGLAELERRWSRIPGLVRAATREAMEEVAGRIVADMNHAKPLVQIDIGWTWGAAPAGSMVLGKVGSQDYGAMSITIYARGDDFAASWFEFGTGPRFHKSGKYVGQIAAQPFFYPVWRTRRRSAKGKITRAINKAIKSA